YRYLESAFDSVALVIGFSHVPLTFIASTTARGGASGMRQETVRGLKHVRFGGGQPAALRDLRTAAPLSAVALHQRAQQRGGGDGDVARSRDDDGLRLGVADDHRHVSRVLGDALRDRLD